MPDTSISERAVKIATLHEAIIVAPSSRPLHSHADFFIIRRRKNKHESQKTQRGFGGNPKRYFSHLMAIQPFTTSYNSASYVSTKSCKQLPAKLRAYLVDPRTVCYARIIKITSQLSVHKLSCLVKCIVCSPTFTKKQKANQPSVTTSKIKLSQEVRQS